MRVCIPVPGDQGVTEGRSGKRLCDPIKGLLTRIHPEPDALFWRARGTTTTTTNNNNNNNNSNYIIS